MSPERICVASASVTMISFSVDKDLQTSALVCPLLAFFMASVESSPSPVSLCGQGPADFTSHLYALYWRSLWLVWNRHHRQFHCVDKDPQTSQVICMPLLAFFMASVESSPSPISLWARTRRRRPWYALYWRSLWLVWNRHVANFTVGKDPQT